MGVLLESYEVAGDWRRRDGAMIDGGARVREAEEAEEDDVDGLGDSGLGSQREWGRGGVVVRVEEEGAGVGAPTPEESSGSPRPWRSEARQQGAWVPLPARRRRIRGRGGRGNPRGCYGGLNRGGLDGEDGVGLATAAMCTEVTWSYR